MFCTTSCNKLILKRSLIGASNMCMFPVDVVDLLFYFCFCFVVVSSC